MTPKELIKELKYIPKELMDKDIKVIIDYNDGIPVYKKLHGISTYSYDWFGFEPSWDNDFLTLKIEQSEL